MIVTTDNAECSEKGITYSLVHQQRHHHMSSYRLTTRIICLLICLLGIPSYAAAQSDQFSWTNLSRLQAGEKIEIIDAASKKHIGTFASFSDDGISYRDSSGERSISKQEVRTVKLAANKRLRHFLIDVGIGAGAGAGISAAAWEDHGFLGNRATGAAVGAALGGVIGGIVGALFPSHTVLYRSASR